MSDERQIANVEPQPINAGLARATEQQTVKSIIAREVAMVDGIDEDFRYKLPRLGKIHLGIKAKTQQGKEYPKATDYFVLPQELLEDEEFREALIALGQDPEKPRVLPVRLPCDSLAANLSGSFDLYGANHGLKCRSLDGITCERVNPQTGEWTSGPCKRREGCPDWEKGDCGFINRLRVTLPDAAGVGYWQIDSKSRNNRGNLYSEMTAIRASAKGKLGGIDVLLKLEQHEFRVTTKVQGQSKLITTSPFLLHLRTPLSQRKLEQAAKEAFAYDVIDVESFNLDPDDAPVVEVGDDFEVGEPELETAQTQEAEPMPEPPPAEEEAADGEFKLENPAPGDDPTTCLDCEKPLTKAQVTFSLRKYGEAYCPACQANH